MNFEKAPNTNNQETILPKNEAYNGSSFSVLNIGDYDEKDIFVAVVTYPSGLKKNIAQHFENPDDAIDMAKTYIDNPDQNKGENKPENPFKNSSKLEIIIGDYKCAVMKLTDENEYTFIVPKTLDKYGYPVYGSTVYKAKYALSQLEIRAACEDIVKGFKDWIKTQHNKK